MPVVFTGSKSEVRKKQIIDNVLLDNELGGNAAKAYVISDAQAGVSGYSFGVAQWDVAHATQINSSGKTDVDLLSEILTNATDSNGKYIIDDGNPSTGRLADNRVNSLHYDLINHNPISATDMNLINSALGSSFGIKAIDTSYDTYLGLVVTHTDTVLSSLPVSAQNFLNTDFGYAFVSDYQNQFWLSSNGLLVDFLQGSAVSLNGKQVQVEGDLGFEDILRFKFSMKWSYSESDDASRRFSNIIKHYPFTPAGPEEALGVLRVFQDILFGRNFTLIENGVIKKAKDWLESHFVTSQGISKIIDGETLVGADRAINGVASIVDQITPNSHSSHRTTNKNDLVFGQSGDDVISGGNGHDVVYGGLGADNIQGGSGDDYLHGHTAIPGLSDDKMIDTISGGLGEDEIYGGGGNDILSGGEQNDEIYGEEGEDTIKGDSGEDTLEGGGGKDKLFGGSDTDHIYAESKSSKSDTSKDELFGEGGEDFLYGDAGEDTLDGGTKNDHLYGEGGNDTLIGGGGIDRLEGGNGYDIYKADDEDTILDSDDNGHVELNGKNSPEDLEQKTIQKVSIRAVTIPMSSAETR
jgi:hypothetical protein